jgi:ABC-type branched-subunit amino acid transport system substrate-binding protein
MQKTLDEILVRQKQEESFRNYVRSEIKSIHTQVELNQEAFDELDDSHNSILKCIKTSKKLMKLFNLEEK